MEKTISSSLVLDKRTIGKKEEIINKFVENSKASDVKNLMEVVDQKDKLVAYNQIRKDVKSKVKDSVYKVLPGIDVSEQLIITTEIIESLGLNYKVKLTNTYRKIETCNISIYIPQRQLTKFEQWKINFKERKYFIIVDINNMQKVRNCKLKDRFYNLQDIYSLVVVKDHPISLNIEEAINKRALVESIMG